MSTARRGKGHSIPDHPWATKGLTSAPIAALQAVVWLSWFVLTWNAPIQFFAAPGGGVLLPLALTCLLWVVLAYLSRAPLPARFIGLCLGSLGSALWIPAQLLIYVCIVYAIVAFVLFALPLTLIPLIIWGTFCGSMALSRRALETLRAARSAT